MTRRKRTSYDVTPEQFIEAWQSSATPEDVANTLKMPLQIVYARASGYRRQGTLRKRAGIRPDEQGEEFVLYTNRHTFITTAGMDATISDALRVEVANHTDARTTQLYTHVREEAVAEAGRRVANTLRAQATPGK